jgi:hypothetical protein
MLKAGSIRDIIDRVRHSYIAKPLLSQEKREKGRLEITRGAVKRSWTQLYKSFYD